jgi:hypothetical protein
MSFQNRTSTTDDVIANAIGSPGKAPAAKRAPKARKPTDWGADETEIARIKRLVKKNYKRDFETGTTTNRILDAIEYLTVEYPSVILPMVLLYWMCNPGPDFLAPTNNEVLFFSKRVSRVKGMMLLKHCRSFFRVGNTKTHAGYFRGYINKEELATYEAPKAGRCLVKAHDKAQTLSAAIGNVNKLELTPQQKDAAREYTRLVATIGQSIKGYLPAPAPKPTSKP